MSPSKQVVPTTNLEILLVRFQATVNPVSAVQWVGSNLSEGGRSCLQFSKNTPVKCSNTKSNKGRCGCTETCTEHSAHKMPPTVEQHESYYPQSHSEPLGMEPKNWPEQVLKSVNHWPRSKWQPYYEHTCTNMNVLSHHMCVHMQTHRKAQPCHHLLSPGAVSIPCGPH